jgi:phage/plasmid-like protein (TIGR03299 family)
MTAVDANTAFDTERAAQIGRIENLSADRAAAEQARAADFEARVKAGQMRALGGGRYQSTQGWDAGEIWYTQRSATGALVLPQHGLDETTGEAALYSRFPEWHQLGTVIPAGLSDIGAVLKAARIDFSVKQRPVEFSVAEGYGGLVHKVVPRAFVNFRDDTMAPLGVVGKIFTPIQPRESFEFLQQLVDDEGVIFESAGAVDGGKRIFVSVLLPNDIIIDPEGIADMVTPHVAIFDRFDGDGSFRAVVTPWRPRCRNTERFAMRDAATSWAVRHTTNALARVQEAQRTLGLSTRYFESFAAEETALARTDVDRLADEIDALIAAVWPEKEADPAVKPGPRAGTIKARTSAERREALQNMAAVQSVELGRTAYMLERVFSDYFDHQAPRRVTGDRMAAARATAAFIGTDDARKDTVHKRLMTLTTR